MFSEHPILQELTPAVGGCSWRHPTSYLGGVSSSGYYGQNDPPAQAYFAHDSMWRNTLGLPLTVGLPRRRDVRPVPPLKTRNFAQSNLGSIQRYTYSTSMLNLG